MSEIEKGMDSKEITRLKDCKKCAPFRVERVKIRKVKRKDYLEELKISGMKLKYDIGVKRKFRSTKWIYSCYAEPMTFTHLLLDIQDVIMAFNHPRKDN